MTTNQIFVFSHFNIYVYSQQILSCFALFLTSFKFFHTENNYSYYSSSYSADKRPLPPTHTHVQHKPTLNWKWLGSRWWISVCFIIYSLNSKLHFIFISFWLNPQIVRSLRTQRVQLWSTAVINISPLSQHSSVYFQVMWCCVQGPYQRAESFSFCSWIPAFSRLSSEQIFTWYCARTAAGCFLTRLEGHHSCWHHFMLQLLEHKVSLQGRPAAVGGALQRLYLCFMWCLQRCIKNRINKVPFSAADLIQSHAADTSEIYNSLISCFRCFRLTCTEGRV